MGTYDQIHENVAVLDPPDAWEDLCYRVDSLFILHMIASLFVQYTIETGA